MKAGSMRKLGMAAALAVIRTLGGDYAERVER
jgi:hypothetical protein